MDAFKTAEVERMKLGGNKPWKDFFNAHASNKLAGREFDSCTIAERYDCEAGEEWKERLTCQVEGREYVPGATMKKSAAGVGGGVARAETGVTPAGSGRNTPLQNVKSPPPQRTASPGQKAKNEAYFARMGAENESRPDNLPPSQGGKYGGFGSAPMPDSSASNNGGMPSGDDFQNDPMAALTKGFGWLSSTVSKQAANVNQAYIQPGMKSFEDGTFAAQARSVGMQAGSFVQQGVRNANTSFNQFVDPDHPSNQGSGAGPGPAMSGTRSSTTRVQPEKKDFWDSFGQDPAGPPREKKDFWDDFAAAGDARMAGQGGAGGMGGGGGKGASIGTSAMKTGGSGGAGGAGGAKKKEEDGWGDW